MFDKLIRVTFTSCYCVFAIQTATLTLGNSRGFRGLFKPPWKWLIASNYPPVWFSTHKRQQIQCVGGGRFELMDHNSVTFTIVKLPLFWLYNLELFWTLVLHIHRPSYFTIFSILQPFDEHLFFQIYSITFSYFVLTTFLSISQSIFQSLFSFSSLIIFLFYKMFCFLQISTNCLL